ncbi:MAG: ABC transporter permease [Lachnospiraceae bacterium]
MEWKKSIKVLGKAAAGLALLIIFTTAGVAAVSFFFLQSGAFNKVQAAIVIPKEEELVKQAVDFAKAMESVAGICEFHYLSESQAWEQMEDGKMDVIILIPENFYEDVYSGINTPATLYLPENVSLNTRIFKELFLQAVSFLQNSEAGVYAALEVAEGERAKMDRASMGDYLAREYALELLKRGRIFDETVLSALGELEIKEYYSLTLLLVLLLMSGLLFGFLYQPSGRALEKKLVMYGLNPKKISLIKILTMTLVLWMLAGVFYLVFVILTGMMEQEWMRWEWRSLPGMGILCFAMAAYFHLFFSLGGKTLQSAALILGINLCMIFCCGLLLPASCFPLQVERAGSFLPLYYWKNYLQNLLFGGSIVKYGLLTLAGALVTAGLGAFAYEKIH